MQAIAKITADDYPGLLEAVEEGVSERELARRYGCAPSLVHRHLVRARRLRELDIQEKAVGDDLVDPIKGSMHAILEARIRDPKTPGRELPGLVNALGRLSKEEEHNPSSGLPFVFRPGTLILEPARRGAKSERRYRMLLRKAGDVEEIADDLLVAEAIYLFGLLNRKELGLDLEAFGLALEDGVVKARSG